MDITPIVDEVSELEIDEAMFLQPFKYALHFAFKQLDNF